MKGERISNQLKKSTSPYLLQHADNPVNWYMWSDEAFEIAKKANKPIFLSIGYSTCQILREMTSQDGGFYSAQDADSEGVEGKFYIFTLDEILNILGEQGKRFAQTFDITVGGNFEGVNIPNLLKSGDLESDFSDEKQKLYDYLRQRTSLHLDDKILLSWNSMMIAAMSMLYRVTHNDKYLKTTLKAQVFIDHNLCDKAQLYTSFRDGKRSEKAFLDDYAYYISALMNPKETYDGAIPSGNSFMAYNFVRLYQLTENEKYRKLAKNQLAFLSSQAQDYPAGHSLFLLSKLLYENHPEHIMIVLKDETDLPDLREKLPFLVNISVVSESEKYPLLNNKTTCYVCRNHICLPSVNELDIS